MEGMMGGEASGPGRRGGITSSSKQAKHETRKRSALSDGTDCFTAIFCRVQPRLQRLAHHSQWAGGRRRP